jgi:AcrR family transcriptional regulator
MRRALTEDDIADFRRRLVAAAEKLFAQHGPDGVTLRQIAMALGVSPMTPYRYFESREAILEAVRAAAWTRFAERLEAARASHDKAGPRGRAVGEAYLAFALEEPDAYSLIFDLSQCDVDSRGSPELMAARARSNRTLTDYMEDLVAEGRVVGDPKKLGLIYWATVHGLVSLYMAGKLGGEAQLRAAYALAINTLTHGARNQTAERRMSSR